MADNRALDELGELPPIGPDGGPLADYVRAVLGPDIRMAVAEPTGRTDVEIPTPWTFQAPLFSVEAVVRLHDAIALINPDTDASRFARVLSHLWRGRWPESLPIDARMAAEPQPDVGDTPQRLLSYPVRRAQLIELRRLARERDLRVSHLCDALRAEQLVATGFSPADRTRREQPIAADW